MPKQPPDPDVIYDSLAGMLAGLKLLQAALAAERAPKPKLAVVAGQGRGSKKPRAKLSSVDG